MIAIVAAVLCTQQAGSIALVPKLAEHNLVSPAHKTTPSARAWIVWERGYAVAFAGSKQLRTSNCPVLVARDMLGYKCIVGHCKSLRLHVA